MATQNAGKWGYIIGSAGATAVDARDATSGGATANPSTTANSVRYLNGARGYNFTRSYFYIDTSSLTSVTAATLNFTIGSVGAIPADINLYVSDAFGGDGSTNLVSTDFDNLNFSSGYTDSTYNVTTATSIKITLNSSAISDINSNNAFIVAAVEPSDASAATTFPPQDYVTGIDWSVTPQLEYQESPATTPTPTPSITPSITPTPSPTPSQAAIVYNINSINGVLFEEISKFNNTNVLDLDSINGVNILDSGPPAPSFTSTTFSFEDQTVVESTGAQWSPSLTHADWANGSSAVNGTYWGLTTNKTVTGWDLAQDTTPSNDTGPQGGATEPSGTPSTTAGSDKYMYTEATSNQNLLCFVARTPGYNFTTEMASTSNNLTLEFWVNAYGDQMADLYVYIDDAATSNHTNATLIDYFIASHSGTQNGGTTTLTQNSNSATYDFVTYAGAVWSKVTLSLNSYKNTNADQYIYFIAQNGTGFKADMGIDLVKIYES